MPPSTLTDDTPAAPLDRRPPAHRRETFQQFYAFHNHYGTHPGLVWALIPWLAERFGWDDEQLAWFCFLNGNTQNPVTSLMLFEAAPSWERADRAIGFWQRHYASLAWDTDRRYHRKDFDKAVMSYVGLVCAGGSQGAHWRRFGSWRSLWREASSLATFGRLSTWSYLEYLFIAGLHDIDAESLMLGDQAGSRSHRNGLCIVSGLDSYDWHASNPDFDGVYPVDLLGQLDETSESLLDEQRRRWPSRAVSRLTLESALCTYKSWHRPRRRYPNVYSDMLYDRIRKAEVMFPERDFSVWWEARSSLLPPPLLLEWRPCDPGVDARKQDHYRLTGEPIMMEEWWPETAGNGFARAVADCEWGPFR